MPLPEDLPLLSFVFWKDKFISHQVPSSETERTRSRGNDESVSKNNRGMLNRRLLRSLFFATQLVDDVADDMYREDQFQWRSTVLGHDFYGSRTVCDHGEGCTNLMHYVKHWLQAHEEAQVMLASILVVVGLWWLVRTVLALLINLVCPLLVVLLAVILVPQLRTPLLGQNYPAVANILGNILIKLAENIKNQECLTP